MNAASAVGAGTNQAMAFGLDEDQRAILDQADRYGRNELYPLCRRMDDEEWWPEEAFPKLGEAGFFGATIPEQYGGAGLDLLAAGLVLQGFSRWNHAMALSVAAHDNLCANNIYRNGNEDQRRRYLPDLCAGRTIGALGLTEPGAGSDALGSMRTTARLDGDHYVLNGSKIYITNGPVADVLLVYAKTDKERGAKGISAFIVEKDFPGFRVAQKLVKMGYRGSQTAELVFEDCRVPVANRVGEENQGVAIVMSGLDLERAMISPICLGVAERALELSIDYAKTRQQFGKPIGSFQMVQSMLADMYVLVETMRSFTYRVLAEAAPLEIGGGGRGDIHMLTAASVMYAAEACHQVLDKAVQVHGGSGYIWESEINRLFRSTKLLEIGAGTTEVRKMIIAGELLKGMSRNG
ncbi:acyl-CoA dehydrogenase family protein [Prosthecomicrobium hirschii]|uniref:Isovaleryl-CoA dehydrogenase n=1 Tax=Prosthecodimorpha hirschii TaxID=665126 RepID=A0A0P6VWD6_9HYPH|nr:acyl-CoA dehydrogenase family protein [Prosthecomicrobium hirschii]KPL51191.1 isovaleryl-CoA dehydrogenase [Prosthecomicrobium hirschii]MCW1838949.1 acyl-CoA dehydrogenase family protein [Prosthecomicrobium hirschii]